MKFYTVSDAYVAHLKAIDNRVPDNYAGRRPYVGIVLNVNGHLYLAPLTSYKPKQDNIATSSPTVFKVHQKGDPENKLGMLQLNNMIPVLEAEISVVDFATQDKKYRGLLTKQLDFIKANQNDLEAKAETLYRLVTVNNNEWACRISCDFLALEAGYQSYAQAAAAAPIAAEPVAEADAAAALAIAPDEIGA